MKLSVEVPGKGQFNAASPLVDLYLEDGLKDREWLHKALELATGEEFPELDDKIEYLIVLASLDPRNHY